MSKRRKSILDQARKIIATGGTDALKIRQLATDVGVTVPTIYNLIGGKPEIVKMIVEELVERLYEVSFLHETIDVEAEFEVRGNNLVELFSEDEEYFKGAFQVGDRSGLFEQYSATGIYSRTLQPTIDLCAEAVQLGLLRGQVSSEQLGQHINGSYRLARQDWTNGYIDLEEFRRRMLTGAFLCLAADAADDYRDRLMQRIATLKQETN